MTAPPFFEKSGVLVWVPCLAKRQSALQFFLPGRYWICIVVELMCTEYVCHSDVLTVVGIEGLGGQFK